MLEFAVDFGLEPFCKRDVQPFFHLRPGDCCTVVLTLLCKRGGWGWGNPFFVGALQ